MLACPILRIYIALNQWPESTNRVKHIDRYPTLVTWTFQYGETSLMLSMLPTSEGSRARIFIYAYHPEYGLRLKDIAVAQKLDLALDLGG